MGVYEDRVEEVVEESMMAGGQGGRLEPGEREGERRPDIVAPLTHSHTCICIYTHVCMYMYISPYTCILEALPQC